MASSSYPSPAERAGRVHRRPLVAVLEPRDADAMHRLCAKRRSGGGVSKNYSSSTPTPAQTRSPTLPKRGREKKERLATFKFQTADVSSPSHGAIPPEFCSNVGPRKTEGAGKAGHWARPQPRARNKKHMS